MGDPPGVVADREGEASVRAPLIDSKRRGLDRPRLFITDDSGGIVSAVSLECPHTTAVMHISQSQWHRAQLEG